MVKHIRCEVAGGASVDYALFMAAASILAVIVLMAAEDNLRPHVVAWQEEKPQIDHTLTGSIAPGENQNGILSKKVEGENIYRIYKLPRALRKQEVRP